MSLRSWLADPQAPGLNSELCLKFHNEGLPPGCEPSRGTVGVESRRDRSFVLLVERGIVYRGVDAEILGWLVQGEREFRTFTEMQSWAGRNVTGESQPAPFVPIGELDRPDRPDDITDLRSVQVLLRPGPAPRADADAVFEHLRGVVHGQDPALRTIAEQAVRHAVRRHPRRPASIFLMGPTGVGKTLAAETLPEALSRGVAGAEFGYLRLDMSEYQEPHRVSQLTGAPQGYVGYNDGAQLPDALTSNPRSVIVFDEIEKAHSDVLRLLMNLIDAGRLGTPSSFGRRTRQIQAPEALLIFTSNAGFADGPEAQNEVEVSEEELQLRLLKAGVAAEIVGRLGAIIQFKPLTDEARARAATSAIVRLGREYGIRVDHIDPVVIAALLRQTPRGRLGFRPVEHRADAVLGPVFVDAANEGRSMISIYGDPIRFHPIA